ncbi:MAG: uroporphyrinogen-III C-methyltransferase [Gammaproteobacteria bacterium]|nr:uroporphyrinogen-III C-methyltransferase [Gammaproteobacteria bacterium]
MSDKEDKNIEQVVEEAQSAAASGDNDETTTEAPEPHVPVTPPPVQAAAKPAPAARKSSSAIAWLALLLVLVLAGGAAWYLQDVMQRETALQQRLAELETVTGQLEAVTGQKEDRLDQLGQRWQQQLQQSMGELQGQAERQAQAVQSFEEELATLRTELARFSAHDRESWLLAEAEYLLRLSNQRLIMAGDTVAAQALLASADAVLRELDDVSLHSVRSAVASDLAAVRAVPKVDLEGIYVRLSALAEQADKLVIFQFPERDARPREATQEDWQARLQQGYEQALLKLSDYVIIRRRDVPMQALMDPQWEGLVRQNLRMLLEQAQVALLSSNQVLYESSLERAQHWVAQFFESDAAAAQAMASEIRQLAALQVQVTMPEISRSLEALDGAIERRLQQGGGE